MTGYDRTELEQFWAEWAAAAEEAQRAGEWTSLARFYAPEASYGWSCSPTDHFMATGRDEIRDWALGTEMHGLQGWLFPYQATVIDERAGQVVAFWRRVTSFGDPDGHPYQAPGIACSWFGYAGERQWAWQRDVFDMGIAGATMIRVIQDGRTSRELEQRVQSMAAGNRPGHVAGPDAGSSPLWPVPGRTG